jgi:hypothetical protein
MGRNRCWTGERGHFAGEEPHARAGALARVIGGISIAWSTAVSSGNDAELS